MPDVSTLALAALGILREGPMHPYEVYRIMLDRRADRVVKVRPGTLYHAITRLADAGLVEVVGTDRDGNRPERTTYAITAAGRTTLLHQVATMTAHPVWEYPSFPVALSELHSLDRGDAVQALTTRAEVLRTEIAVQAAAVDRLVEEHLPVVFWLELSYTHRLLTAEVDWIAALLEDLGSGAVDWSERTVHTAPSTWQTTDHALARTSPLFPDLPPRKGVR